MTLIEPGQIWENKHLLNHEYDVIVRWANDSFVWSHYLDDDDLCKESRSDFLNIRKLKLTIPSPSLDEGQQIVLEWLKEKYTITNIEPVELLWRLHVTAKDMDIVPTAYRLYKFMTKKAKLEVLQVFSKWALEQESD